MTQAVPNPKSGSNAPAALMHDLSWRLVGSDASYAVSLLVAQLWLGLLWFFYQGFGIERGVILCCLLAGLFFLRFFPRPRSASRPAGAEAMTPNLKALLALAVVLDVALMAVSSTRSLETSKIPMDEGQTSWRAARLLWQGENPYGSRALVDLNAYRSRAPQRNAAGFHSALGNKDEDAALARYDATLDRRLRDELLPPQQNADSQRESHLYGYKYGPLILLSTAAIVPFGAAGSVMVLNGFISFALFAIMWLILRRISGAQIAIAGAAMLALLLDRHITRNYINRSATDVWALLFGALAVLACLARRWFACAAAVACAVGCKTLPGLLFLPLLLRPRSVLPLLLFCVIAIAIYVPWFIWNPPGLLYNGLLWPLYMRTDATSWQFFTPHWTALAARAAILLALTVLWLRYVLAREERLFWTLAVSSTLVLLASGFLRNGYVPWVSLWAVAAIAEAFSPRYAAASSVDRAEATLNRRTVPAG